MKTIRFVSTGHYVPDHVVTNDDLAKVVDTNDEWITSRTGIKQRCLSDGIGASQMAANAAKKALEKSGYAPEEIDLIVVASTSMDILVPSGAAFVQSELGAVNAVAFDINAACTGFMFALSTAYAYITAGMAKKAIIIGSENLSRIVDWSDRGTCVLFGDGAGAAVVEESESGVEAVVTGTDGTKGSVLSCESRPLNNPLVQQGNDMDYVKMDGQEVFKFAVRKVPEVTEQVLNQIQCTTEDVDLYVLHQANERIVQSVAKRLKVDISKFPVNLHNYGNTSAASIPILLDELEEEGQLVRGNRIVISGFGGGLTWGAASIIW